MTKKLLYFEFKGLGEPVRYILHYGRIEFEDVRYIYTEWDKKKNEVPTPFGKLPVFIDGDRVLNQSVAITRYIGRSLGLVPADPYEEAAIDAAILTLEDFLDKVWLLYRVDVQKKEVLKKELIDEVIPFYFSRFENILKENNGHIGKKLTWADFVFINVVEIIGQYLQIDLSEPYPNVKSLVKKIKNLPGVKEYIADRGDFVPEYFIL